MKIYNENDTLTIYLEGKIDSLSAPGIASEINQARQKYSPETIILDCDKLEYISSAGLRLILRIKQEVEDTRLINVHTDIYDIFDMTGITEMMTVEKAYRVISVEGCEVIGQGANGKIYQIDRDTIVKVFMDADALEEINRQRELARTAFVLGIPTAIPFDVVKIKGGGLGSVYELLNAASYAKLLINKVKTFDEVAAMSIKMLKLIHSKVVKPDTMPDEKIVVLDWADFLKDYLPAEQYKKLYALINAVPTDFHMMHGDYHIKNVMLQDGESLLIDMDTLCHGHPIFELASMYNSYVGYGAIDQSRIPNFLGIDADTAKAFWRKSLELYLGTTDKSVIEDVENKAMIVGYTRIMRRTIRRNGLNTETGRAEIDNCKAVLADLLPKTDTLLF